MLPTETADIHALEPKAKVSGKIIKITLAGALVDIGQPVPGLLHISQLQKEPVNKVEDVLKEGQLIEAWVRRAKKDRVELTMIQPLLYDWKDLEPEMVVKGKVVRLESYGAFVDIGAERPGMIHVSELAHGYVKNAGEAVREGQEIEAKVINVDRQKRQIRLSLKALQPVEEREEKPAHEPKRGRKAHKNEEPMMEMEEKNKEPELTAMQIAWQTAQDRANSKEKAHKTRRVKLSSVEQEEILNRTLKKRLPTGA